MTLRSLSGVLIAVSFAVLPLQAVADNHENVSSIWVLAPKQGMTAEFEAAMTDHVAFRAEKGDPRNWRAYSVAVGDKMGMYQVRGCCFEWAGQDAYIAATADMGLGDHFNETVGPYVGRIHHYFDVYDYENSSWPVDDVHETHEYFGVTSWRIKEGNGPGPSEARKKISQLAIETGWGEVFSWLWHTREGGKPTLMVVVPYENYAGMAPPEQGLVEHIAANSDMSAEEVGALFTTFGSGFSSSDYTVWRYRPELSMPQE